MTKSEDPHLNIIMRMRGLIMTKIHLKFLKNNDCFWGPLFLQLFELISETYDLSRWSQEICWLPSDKLYI